MGVEKWRRSTRPEPLGCTFSISDSQDVIQSSRLKESLILWDHRGAISFDGEISSTFCLLKRV
jgi:hypothetical protein